MARTAKEALARLLDVGIKPHTAALAETAAAAGVSVVVFEADAAGQKAARAAGWDGKAGAFRMDDAYRLRLASNSDAVTAAWLRREEPGVRVFVFTEAASLLVNFTEGRGWHFEPGSTDAERV